MGILQTAERSSHLDPSENVIFQRHLIELKLLSVKILEEINKRDLYELDSYQRKSEEVDYVEACSEAFENSPNLTTVPQGGETLPYLNREAKN